MNRTRDLIMGVLMIIEMVVRVRFLITASCFQGKELVVYKSVSLLDGLN